MLPTTFFSQLAQKATEEGVEVFVASAAINRGGRVLLIRRSKDDFLPGLFEFPGGKVEDGEGLDEAVRREVMEETGLVVVDILDYLGHFEYKSGSGRRCRQFNFEGGVEDDSLIKLVDHDEKIWADPDDVNGIFVSDKLKAILKNMWSR